MGTITFEVHPITPTSPRNTLAIIFKSILIFVAFIFLFEHIMDEHIRERKEIPNYISLNITILLCRSTHMLYMISGEMIISVFLLGEEKSYPKLVRSKADF